MKYYKAKVYLDHLHTPQTLTFVIYYVLSVHFLASACYLYISVSSTEISVGASFHQFWKE